CQKYINTPFTF
nr:immunoglobulin light chain junction region [Macaca mulatta]